MVKTFNDKNQEAEAPSESDRPTPRTIDLTTKILDFLSTASNDTLTACFAVLGVATYVILGRVGLVLIGVLGGIVLHATWEGEHGYRQSIPEADLKRRKQSGIDIIKRLLDLEESRRTSVSTSVRDKEDFEDGRSTQEFVFDEPRPKTTEALEAFVDAIIDNYVKWWYTPILPLDMSFPTASRQLLVAFIATFSSRISRRRPADIFLNFLTNSASILVVFLEELSRALTTPEATAMDSADAIYSYLEKNPASSLATVLDRKEQEKKLKAVAEEVLRTFLDAKTYGCEPVRAFFRETLSGLILESTLQACAKADWINGWIVYLLEDGEPEILNAIDVGVGNATATGGGLPPPHSQRSASSDLQRDHSTLNEPRTNPEQVSTGNDDDATKMAMLEAKRLSEMIAAEEANQSRFAGDGVSSTTSADVLQTSTSSEGDLPAMDQNISLRQESMPASGGSQGDEAEERPSQDLISSKTETFTNFDQLGLPAQSESESAKIPPLTLHNAKVLILDDALSTEKATMRSKPTSDFLLQIEPASLYHSGWMIARKYVDFETLHEVLRRISVVSGVPEFTRKFVALPSWKNRTKSSLRLDLEAYLGEALLHLRLAESEGMKRFLEKDQALNKITSSKGLLGFPSPEAFQSVGKGMLDVLASAPKGAAGGGRALFEGVSGVFQKKSSGLSGPRSLSRSSSSADAPQLPEEEHFSTNRPASIKSDIQTRGESRIAEVGSFSAVSDNTRNTASTSTDTTPRQISDDNFARHHIPEPLHEDSLIAEEESGLVSQSSAEENAQDYMHLKLPPPPSEITEEYESGMNGSLPQSYSPRRREDTLAESKLSDPRLSAQNKLNDNGTAGVSDDQGSQIPKAAAAPLTADETSVAVELLFAVISELFKLSSVWGIRRTLLNAAKAFLLRPGNPNLEAIRVLLQEQVINANTSDLGIATQLRKMRENSMPTDEELAKWPPPLSQEEHDRLQAKARQLLIEQGMPPALKSVMGSAASSEALGRIFDSLQIEDVSRGLIFALMFQAVRILTH